MDFHFVAPDLRELDRTRTEVVACCAWSDVRPLPGTAGLVDFRLAGRLSTLLRRRFFDAERGETLMVPGRPRLPFDKVVVFGLGARSMFDEDAWASAIGHMSGAIHGLKVTRAVVELPGRADAAVGPERTAELLLAAACAKGDDVWWLVEDASAQRVMSERFDRERRVRRSA